MPHLYDEKLEQLIDTVRRNDFIYNPSNRRHTDSYFVESFWEDLAKSLDVENMDALACQKRWRNMRDSYVKHKRRVVMKGGRAPRYKFAKQLAFLDAYLQPGKLSRLSDEVEEERSLSEQEDTKDEPLSLDESQAIYSPVPVFPSQTDKPNSRETINHQSYSSWQDDSMMPPTRECQFQYPRHQQDADFLLFESYALRLKALPFAAQSVIKMQMSQIFFNAENTTGDVMAILPSRKRKASASCCDGGNGEMFPSDSVS